MRDELRAYSKLSQADRVRWVRTRVLKPERGCSRCGARQRRYDAEVPGWLRREGLQAAIFWACGECGHVALQDALPRYSRRAELELQRLAREARFAIEAEAPVSGWVPNAATKQNGHGGPVTPWRERWRHYGWGSGPSYDGARAEPQPASEAPAGRARDLERGSGSDK